MDIYLIDGAKKLSGEIPISGAKNAALPLIVASLLADGETTLKNVPDLKDIRTIISVIECLGAETDFNVEKNILKIRVKKLINGAVPYDLVKTMRASIYVMGPMLARIGESDVSLPGGCAIGERPVDIHLSGFEAMGATIELDEGYIRARADKLTGNRFFMRQVSVGATANLMMAAVLAKGKTVLENSAREPDIVDLGKFLIKMGAKIEGLGTETIVITGVKKLEPTTYTVMPDRIEAGTMLLAGAITRSEITVTKIDPLDLEALFKTLTEIGFGIEIGPDWAKIMPGKNYTGTIVRTLPHPGFPTDLQAPMMALMATIPGISVIIENIFENRFTHIPELRRLGADITTEGKVAIIRGVKQFKSATVMMSDLRAGAALVLAALAAKGTTEIRRIYHADRGYEKLEQKLTAAGGTISRKSGGKL